MENQNFVINEKVAAAHLGISVQTLRNWRHLRKGPTYCKIGRAVRYRTSDLEEFVENSMINLNYQKK